MHVKYGVLLENGGTGYFYGEKEPKLGTKIEIESHDENGNTCTYRGKLKEILSVEELG